MRTLFSISIYLRLLESERSDKKLFEACLSCVCKTIWGHISRIKRNVDSAIAKLQAAPRLIIAACILSSSRQI